jgi:hypothetical protein
MEVFSMPLPNKIAMDLPSPHPIGLMSHCSTLLGSPPLWLCWATAPCWIHAPRPPRSPPLRLGQALTPCQIHALPGPLPLNPCQIHILPVPHPSTPAPQTLLGPSSKWDDQIHAPPGSLPLGSCQIHSAGNTTPWAPSPSDSAGPQLHVGLEPHAARISAPQGWAPAWHETTHLPACQDPRFSGRGRLQLYRLSR